MRTVLLHLIGFGAVATATTIGAGCIKLTTCDDVLRSEPCDGPRTSTSSGGGGSGGGTPVGCIPSENPDAIVGDECGVFVGGPLGKDTNPGTKAAPLATLGAAIKAADKGSLRVYACSRAGDEPMFNEAVTVGTITVYGGLACEDQWAYSNNPTRLTAPAGMIPLTINGILTDDETRMEDFYVVAADATTKGGSSVAAVANQAEVTFKNMTFEAGNAREGAAGEEVAGTGMDGAMGIDGELACSADLIAGGDAVTSDCGTPEDATDDSISGPGGVGQQMSGNDGTSGDPGSAANANGGAGQGTVDTNDCAAGAAGAPGEPGMAGAGGTTRGEVHGDGFTGNGVGSPGLRGLPAQGGGGGGASKGGDNAAGGRCENKTGKGGASGGSGGSGGCGGLGGNGGQPGGSSIALIGVNAMITFESGVTLRAKQAGAGGDGGLGQSGGAGAPGGVGGMTPAGTMDLKPGCAGGIGGTGGIGGYGGGGYGGHSLGLAYTGLEPTLDGVTIEHAATGGAGGLGGDDLATTDDGHEGTAADMQDFPGG
jgi:hypothetical protein